MRVSKIIKPERHHWWPVCVSANWADDEGCVNWLLPNGDVRRAPPKNFGVIGSGHHIKLGHRSGEATVWDQNFEPEFQRADDNFPSLIEWLEGLDRKFPPSPKPKKGLAKLLQSFNGDTLGEVLPLQERFLAQAASESDIARLAEGIVSLAVRSPMNREAAVSLAEHVRGQLPERERNALIGMNMRNSHRDALRVIGTRGKFAILYSPYREFIYGDGFFHTIRAPVQSPISPKILAPITPRIAVLFARPTSYRTEPRLSTVVITTNEADQLNHAVQVYARSAIFYRADRPAITDAYRQEKHLVYSDLENPVDRLIYNVPGVPPRDTSLDFLFARTRSSINPPPGNSTPKAAE